MTDEIKLYSRDKPSEEYIRLIKQYTDLHANGDKHRDQKPEDTYPGDSLGRWVDTIGHLSRALRCNSVTDYGAGKGIFYKSNLSLKDSEGTECIVHGVHNFWGCEEHTLYDPCVEGISTLPIDKSDLVVCTDVLEHVPFADADDWIIDEIFSLSNKLVFLNIASYPAQMHLPSGENAHCSVYDAPTWIYVIDRVAKKYPNIHFYASIDERVVDENGKPIRMNTKIYTNLPL